MINSYCESMLKTLLKRLWIVAIAAALCGAAFGGAAYYKAKGDNGTVEEKQAAIDTYLAQVDTYEQAIADSRAALEQARAQAKEMQGYVDNATYMKLNGDCIYVAQAQYTVTPAEGSNTNIGNVLNAINLYVTQGGLKEDADAADPDLNAKYWGELITTAISGNNYSVAIMQPTEELAKSAIDAIKNAVKGQRWRIANSQGEFTLTLQDTAYYTKSEAGIVNALNNNRNTLKNYLTSVSDYETRVYNQQNTLDQYIEKNKPDSLDPKAVDAKSIAKKLAVIGAFVGIWVGLGLAWIDFLAGNRVRKPGDLAKLGLNVVGVHSSRKGCAPEAAQTALAIRQILGVRNISSASICTVKNHKKMPEICGTYAKALEESGMPCKCVSADSVSAEDLKDMLSADSVVLAVRTGVTRYADVENAIKLCQLYGLQIAGAIVSK